MTVASTIADFANRMGGQQQCREMPLKITFKLSDFAPENSLDDGHHHHKRMRLSKPPHLSSLLSLLL
ncbi:hypothetical protein TYRP_006959 [Tyrophagus putrescentiae]|nr:hypothetical protein TYRP_006959 [Tyrophagus putrescentiae]